MQLATNQNVIRWIIIVSSFIIISLILWNTYVFFQNFKAEERTKMQTWSLAQENLIGSESNDEIIVTSRIIESNTTTPMILLNPSGEIISSNNISEEKLKNPLFAKRMIEKFRNENNPIPVMVSGKLVNTVYYGNSPLLNKLKYYPLALMLIILLFAAVAYFFYRSSKNAAENKLWTGMAKETAHQIGTPLSSLVGWTEILRSENTNPEYLMEIEKDISRLQTITDRFSKIGSIPTLEKTDVVTATQGAYNYLKSRSSKLIDFDFTGPNEIIQVNLNEQLYSWTIENLVKNAIDAMKGKGSLKIAILQNDKFVNIQVQDSGNGIPKSRFKKIFEPGFTSKKRGWGLGLSLAKRIIEDYHQGKIKVESSEIGSGSTMQITLKRV